MYLATCAPTNSAERMTELKVEVLTSKRDGRTLNNWSENIKNVFHLVTTFHLVINLL